MGALAKRLLSTPARPKRGKAGPPGGSSVGTTWMGGPQWTDPFQSRRAPTPWQLIEKYVGLIYACVARARDAVVKVPLRLYADGSRVQGGKPRGACDPIRVSRSAAVRLAEAGLVSGAAVDNVYEIRNHPLLDTLDRPDPYGYFTRRKLIGLLSSYQDVVGSGYLVPEGNGWDWRREGSSPKGPPDYLWVIYPQYVLPQRDGSTPLIAAWRYFRDTIPFGAVLWFRHTLSLRDPYGAAYSPTYAGDLYSDQEQKFTALWDQVLGIGPRPSMIASAKDPALPPGQDQRKRLEHDLARKHSGAMAGGVLVNDGAWEFTPTSYPPADMAGKDVSEYDRNCLASIFGLPPTYFTTDTNLANLEAADESFSRFCVEPRLDTIADTLTDLVRQWDPRLFFKADPVTGEDEEAKQKVVDMRLARGQTTINQENEELKYPPVPWGDAPWIPGTLKQPDMITAEHEQGIEAQKASIEQGKAQVDQGDQKLKIEDKKASQPKPPMSKAASLGAEIARELIALERALAG